MKRLLLAALAVMAFSTAGCMDTIMGWFGMGGGGSDPAAQYIDTMKTTPMVMYFNNFHAKPAVGQWATFKDFSGETWYGVVGGEDDAWHIEKRASVPGQDFKVATLMLVNNKGEVQKAWAAPYDAEAEELPEGVEVKVMEKPAPVKAEGGEAAEGPKPEWSKDTVAGLASEKMSIDVQGKTSETWFAKDAYFAQFLAVDDPKMVNEKGGVVKSAYDGKVNSELLEQGKADIAASMTLPEAK